MEKKSGPSAKSVSSQPGTSRRGFLGFCGGAMASMALPKQALSASAGANRPNIIMIMADDASATDFSGYGSKEINTPTVDAIGSEGVQFRTCWASPLCAPTRAMLMTGKYAYQTGWWRGPSWTSKTQTLADFGTFAHPLRQAGYATAVCGKWQLHRGTADDFGFDEYSLYFSYKETPNYSQLVNQFPGPRFQADFGLALPVHWYPFITQNDQLLDTTNDDYGPDLHVDFMLDFAKRKKDQPFMIYYPMILPHVAYDYDTKKNSVYLPVPELDAAGNKTGGRVAGSLKSNIEYGDHLVSRLLKGLDELGLRENTYIIFSTDNGAKGYGKGRTTQERGPRVPLVIDGPGVPKLGKVDTLVSLVDMFPTLCDLSDVPMPSGHQYDGTSFARLLKGESFEGREWIHSYLQENQKFLRDNRWLLDGDGKFWDTHGRRDETGYTDVTNSNDAEVVAAKQRFNEILVDIKNGSTGVPTSARRPRQQARPSQAQVRGSLFGNQYVDFHVTSPGHVSVSVLDSRGRLARQINCGMKQAGRHNVSLGRRLPNGRYYVRVKQGAATYVSHLHALR